MKYFGGCDVGSTFTKAVILDETGKMVADTTIRSKINSEQSAIAAMEEVCKQAGLKDSKELEYLIGTGYGRNKVPFADENISEISCHAMGVHITDPSVKAIIDIGGQDVKGISIDTDGTVKNFAMNDKCSAGTGRFFEAMARSFEMSLPEFSKLSLTAKNVIPITAQCTVFAESEVITLVGEGKPMDEIAAGIEMAVAKRCFVMAKKAGATDSITLTGGCAKNDGLKTKHIRKKPPDFSGGFSCFCGRWRKRHCDFSPCGVIYYYHCDRKGGAEDDHYHRQTAWQRRPRHCPGFGKQTGDQLL